MLFVLIVGGCKQQGFCYHTTGWIPHLCAARFPARAQLTVLVSRRTAASPSMRMSPRRGSSQMASSLNMGVSFLESPGPTLEKKVLEWERFGLSDSKDLKRVGFSVLWFPTNKHPPKGGPPKTDPLQVLPCLKRRFFAPPVQKNGRLFGALASPDHRISITSSCVRTQFSGKTRALPSR